MVHISVNDNLSRRRGDHLRSLFFSIFGQSFGRPSWQSRLICSFSDCCVQSATQAVIYKKRTPTLISPINRANHISHEQLYEAGTWHKARESKSRTDATVRPGLGLLVHLAKDNAS